MHSRTSQATGDIAPVDICRAPSIVRGASRIHVCVTLIPGGEWFRVVSAKGYGNVEEEGSILAGDGG